MAGYAAVIGDVVGSRRHPDPARLDAKVDEAISAVNEAVAAVQPLSRTIGDEFQGVYAEPVSALRATLLVRLPLVGESDLRFGVGWGRLFDLEEGAAPLRQDGPGWWAAREAVDLLKTLEGTRRSPRGWRTCFAIGEEVEAEQPPFLGAAPGLLSSGVEPFVNAHLVCRDELVGAMDARDARIALGLLAGRELSAIALDEGISAAAVSQRAIRSGAYAVLHADALLLRSLGA